jgi:CelD/BcsL family acetyltransferase involved in cellulose biosynthesis
MRALLGEGGIFPGLPFVAPAWLENWWRAFGSGAKLALLSVRRNSLVAGVAPLLIRENTASFIGSPELCDYLDFIVTPGEEQCFFTAVLRYLFQNGISKLDLRCLRPEASALNGFKYAAEEMGADTVFFPEDVSVELKLPGAWDQYLEGLNKKQRHEIRRKLNRLMEAGPHQYYVLEGDAALSFMPKFLEMFRLNPDKANFLSGAAALFFPAVIRAAVLSGLARFGVLELAGRPAAAALYMDYHGKYYLYNSAYDPAFSHLSAGLLCKILNIKDAIYRGRLVYDFLKGGEEYKHRLGGIELTIYRCMVTRPECRAGVLV